MIVLVCGWKKSDGYLEFCPYSILFLPFLFFKKENHTLYGTNPNPNNNFQLSFEDMWCLSYVRLCNTLKLPNCVKKKWFTASPSTQSSSKSPSPYICNSFSVVVSWLLIFPSYSPSMLIKIKCHYIYGTPSLSFIILVIDVPSFGSLLSKFKDLSFDKHEDVCSGNGMLLAFSARPCQARGCGCSFAAATMLSNKQEYSSINLHSKSKVSN